MPTISPVTIEGYTIEGLLGLPDEQVDAYIFTGEPVVFRAGSAEILGRFGLSDDTLLVELVHLDGGGEGVLATLWNLADQLAAARGRPKVEWLVHAVHCARPNLKLRRVLELRGFTVDNVEGVGEVYRHVHETTGGSSSGAG